MFTRIAWGAATAIGLAAYANAAFAADAAPRPAPVVARPVVVAPPSWNGLYNGYFWNLTNHLDWFGTVRGRIGFTLGPRTLLYGTGGVAFGGVTANENVTVDGTRGSTGIPPGTTTVQARATENHVGWTVGV